MKKKYILENLGCAHCAGKMEAKINKLEGVEEAIINYPTKLLHLTAEDPDSYLEQIQEICASIESQVVVVPRDAANAVSEEHDEDEHHHDHEEHCDCGHDHEHHDHEHDDHCDCDHEHDEDCECGHDHDHEHEHEHHHDEDEDEHAHHDHDHEEQTEHHEEESSDLKKKDNRLFIGIGIAILAFAAGHFLHSNNLRLIIYLIAYLVLAKDIILEAIHGIGRGQIFDENFLMSIATLGALMIGEYPEALGVILFYRIGEAFEEHAVEKSRKSIMDAVNMRPETVLQVHGDHTHEIPAEKATVGMTILVRPGDRIPLDGIIVDGETQLDTSALTGEPVPVLVKEGDEILSGCVNQTGVIKLEVTKPLSESMVTRIMESMEDAAASKPKMDRFITRFSKIYTPIVVLVALATAIIPSMMTGAWDHWVYTALTFLVISCPCALVLSVPLSFFSAIGLGSRQGILFKGGASLEVLKEVQAVIMDKTGTITEGNFVVSSIHPVDNVKEDELLAMAATCEQNSTHPIAKSILTAAAEKGILLTEPTSITEEAGHGIDAVIGEHNLLCGNHRLMDEHEIVIPELETLYGTEILLAIDGLYAGRILISDTIKDDSESAISELNRSVATIMLTGDSEESAKVIAEKTGVTKYFAKLLPDDKLRLLQEAREEYGPVMFVGDGINDAPVLAGADCGAAMGSGADAAIEAADVVFMTSKLSAITESIRIAKLANHTAMQNIVFALAVKLAVMVLGLMGIASMWLAVFADTGVAVLCVLNSVRILKK
ncbi:MAG: cadmium-translocating P-type ATPase [Lachnospiraceae bacterium]|nr:cadmium-translocating P-type ATPase [Lachnospiraceae bacterium]